MRINFPVLVLLLAVTANASANYFDFDTTDANCSVLIMECYLMTGIWDENDELGLFTAAGVCGGSTIVTGFPLGIAAWGDDALTDSVTEGFHNGDSILFKRWDASEEREIDIEKLWVLEGESDWQSNSLISVELSEQELNHISIIPTFVRHRIICTSTEIYDGDVGFDPQMGDQAAITTSRGTFGGVMIWMDSERAWGWAYQDDSSTEEVVEGFTEGEQFQFVFFRPDTGLGIEIFSTALEGDDGFTPNGSTIVHLWNDPVSVADQAELPQKFEILGAHPNPFNDRTLISVAIPQQSSVTITIFSYDGRQVYRKKSVDLSAGIHTIPVDMKSLPSGNYLFKFDSSSGSGIIPLILTR